jgi:hypothetical protein
MSWDDFYSHLVAIRNAQESPQLRSGQVQWPPTGVAWLPKPWHRWPALVIRKSSRVNIARAGTKFHWSEVQFLRG